MTRAVVRTRVDGVNCRGEEGFEVKLRVQLPQGASVDGESDFGNVIIRRLDGNCKLDLEYGNLDAGELNGRANDISVEFGNAHITRFGGGKLNTEYGKLRVDAVRGAGKISSEFGSLDVGPIDFQAGDLVLSSEFGDLNVVFSEGGDFAFEVTSSFGEISLPDNVQGKVTRKDYTSKEVKGRVGKGGGARVLVRSEFGGVKIR
jgi:hypothetical protein